MDSPRGPGSFGRFFSTPMRLFLLAVLVLVPALATAQAPVVLTLPPAATVSADVSVARAIDLRADTSSVGEAKVGLLNRRRPVVVAGGAAEAVGAYLRTALPPGGGRTPLVVGIDRLAVSEQTTAMTEFGRAEVRLRFFEERDGGLVEVGQTSAFVEGRGMDVTRGHADRLADALDEALAQFLVASRPDVSGVAAVPEAEVVSRAAAAPAARAAVSMTEQAARSIRTFVAGGPIVGVNAVGARIGYGIRRPSAGAWEFPLGFEATALKTENPETGLEGTFTSYSGTALAARRLGASQVFLQPGVQITGGTEQVHGETEWFFGGRLGLDLVRYPADAGLVAGVGVYGARLFGSELYPRDVGVSGIVGVQF